MSDDAFVISNVTFSFRFLCADCQSTYLLLTENELTERAAEGRQSYYSETCTRAHETRVTDIVVFEKTKAALTEKYGPVAPLVLERDESRNGPSEGESP